MEYLYCSLLGYFIGSVNPSYFLCKTKGFDIREKGSHNAGASNALMLLGKASGVICALIDIAKAYFVIMLARMLFPKFIHTFAVTGVACIIGHIFPFYMKLKGGKGLACLGGMILFYDFRIFLVMLLLEVVLALIVDYICIIPISASIIFPIVYAVRSADYIGAVIMLIATVVMLYKHIENVKRIKDGTEIHLSYLWRPDEEMDRMKDKLSSIDEDFDEHFDVISK